MPPVAKEETTDWGKALFAVLEAHRERDESPYGWYGLAKALAEQEGTTQNQDSWLSTLKRIRKKGLPNEDQALSIALALRVKRSSLPASSQRQTVGLALAEVARVEADVQWATRQLRRLAEIVDIELEPAPGDEDDQSDPQSGDALP